MAAPIIQPDTVGEQAAEPERVDYPVQEVVSDLPAETTSDPEVRDTGYIWDEFYPGDTQLKAQPGPVKVRAVRTTEVSDGIIFGRTDLGPNTPPFILAPAHRDRLRVTVQIDGVGAVPIVYLGSGPDLAPTNGWQIVSTAPLPWETRDKVYVATGAGAGTVRVQWAIEMASEGCGCGG